MNILIAEDDSTSALALKGILTNLGHEVAVTTNGLDAYKHWSLNRNKIIILDWMMPIMDGIEVCKKIRAEQSVDYTCIILLTAKQEREDRVHALKSGADVFLTKPLVKEELIARLQVAERIIELESPKYENKAA
jgi:DNA-binding response OmpR family regulator